MAGTAPMQTPPHCDRGGPRPRVYTYTLPKHLHAAPDYWRQGKALLQWVRTSVHHEPDGDCADYWLLPGFPPNVFSRADMRRLCDDPTIAILPPPSPLALKL